MINIGLKNRLYAGVWWNAEQLILSLQVFSELPAIITRNHARSRRFKNHQQLFGTEAAVLLVMTIYQWPMFIFAPPLDWKQQCNQSESRALVQGVASISVGTIVSMAGCALSKALWAGPNWTPYSVIIRVLEKIEDSRQSWELNIHYKTKFGIRKYITHCHIYRYSKREICTVILAD